MKYVVTLRDKTYEVEVENGSSFLFSGVRGAPALPFSAVGGTTALPGARGSSRPTVAPKAWAAS